MPASPSTPSSLTVPPSQNTAPVIKFRCLYTYDLRRKAKRWQDGFLRFHTFNKRVMVYDTPGNFIGDLHWRQGSAIQDGDEFELDKGVIVQVCEPMERTETDLSKLFENKKSVQSPRRAQPLTQSPRRSPLQSSMTSQPRPGVSLNSLLGIRRTPIGRIATPHEARPSHAQGYKENDSDRAAKRQRVFPDRRHQESRQQTSNPPVIDLSESSTPPEANATTHSAPSLLQSGRDSAPTVSNIPSRPNPTPNQNPTSSSHDTLPSTSRTQNPPPETTTNTLRLSSEKPRKKLMYRALLPNQASAKPAEPAQSAKRSYPFAQSDTQSQSVETVAPSYPLTSTDFTPSDSTQFALDEIRDIDGFDDKPSANADHSHTSGQRPTTQLPNTDPSGSNLPIPPPPIFKQNPPVPIPRRMSPQKGLRKSLSDPIALTGGTGIQPSRFPGRNTLATLDEDKVSDQGPWTSEALDLFEFWPPGRPKPI